MHELHLLSALAQASLVRRREITVAELVRHHLARIAALDARLTAFVQLRPEQALATARRLDAALQRDPHAPKSRLFGLPTGMKDVHFTRGFFVRAGSRAFRWMWSPWDDVTSATVRRAGMVILGKLTTSELALLPMVEPDIHAPTRNPWDPTRTAGGSSGGSAAAVAAYLLPLAAASDGGGSIRIPAAFCGLVGHKPTRGLVPNPFKRFEPLELSVVGPHARDVDDAAALLDVLCGREGRDDAFLERVRLPPRPMRIAFTCTAPLGGEVDAPVRAALARVVRALADLGHHLEEAPPLDGDLEDFLPLFDYLVYNTFVLDPRVLQPVTRWLRERGRGVTRAAALACRERLARRARAWLGSCDIAVTPTVPRLPPLVGAVRGLAAPEAMKAVAPLAGFTAPFNASGQPATSVPVWLDGQPLPIGVQLVGRAGDDVRLLATARAIMQALGR